MAQAAALAFGLGLAFGRPLALGFGVVFSVMSSTKSSTGRFRALSMRRFLFFSIHSFTFISALWSAFIWATLSFDSCIFSLKDWRRGAGTSPFSWEGYMYCACSSYHLRGTPLIVMVQQPRAHGLVIHVRAACFASHGGF